MWIVFLIQCNKNLPWIVGAGNNPYRLREKLCPNVEFIDDNSDNFDNYYVSDIDYENLKICILSESEYEKFEKDNQINGLRNTCSCKNVLYFVEIDGTDLNLTSCISKISGYIT